jgi:hypothetical protein
MAINLWRIDKKNMAILIAVGSFIYSIGVAYFGFLITYEATSRLMVLMLNLVGGNILSAPVWRNTIGRMPFVKANPWIPLVFVIGASVIISLLLFAWMSYFIRY